MTEIRIYPRAGLVWLHGHADYAEKGKDIVCAGVSALAIALGRTTESTGGAWLEDPKDGDMKILCGARHKTWRAALRTVREGWEALEQAYPEHVRVYVMEKEEPERSAEA